MNGDPAWTPVSYKQANRLINMTSGQTSPTWEAIAREQLLGAVDLYARLGTRGGGVAV